MIKKCELQQHFMKTFLIKATKNLCMLLLIMALIFSTSINDVFAQGGIVLSTTYPGITVKAGENVELPLKIKNSGPYGKSVELSIVSIPDGWKSSFEGRGKTVHKVFVDGNAYENVHLNIKIPSKTTEGDYKIIAEAKGNGVSDRLTLDLKVREGAKEASKLIVQYPELQGSASTTFKFRVDLTNSSDMTQSYSLGAKVPRGWEVSFVPAYSSKQIASIGVKPDSSEGLDVEINPPRLVKAGEYTIPITATSADETLSADLKVIIKGTYDIKLSTPTGRLNAETYAGKETKVKLMVTNMGSADLKDVKFSSWEPSGWSVKFEPEELEVLPAGESKEIKAYIKPDSKAIAGDYVVEMRASTPEDSSSAEFRVMVKTSTLWGIVGVILIGALVYGLYWTFKKYGRR
jgi:uncharacterized membrane protein